MTALFTDKDVQAAVEPYKGHLHRFVEEQSTEATMLLVDSAEEFEILEAALEETKPEFPPGIPADPAFYLLTSPFRYQPEGYGSRFRAIGDVEHVLYAAENEQTALLEFTAYRLKFYLQSEGGLPTSAISTIAFSFCCNHERAIDLRKAPFSDDHSFKDPEDYSSCQKIAERARLNDIGVILYESVRDPDLGCNAAILQWAAIDTSENLATGSILKLFFKEDRVLAIRGMGKMTKEMTYSQLLRKAETETVD